MGFIRGTQIPLRGDHGANRPNYIAFRVTEGGCTGWPRASGSRARAAIRQALERETITIRPAEAGRHLIAEYGLAPIRIATGVESERVVAGAGFANTSYPSPDSFGVLSSGLWARGQLVSHPPPHSGGQPSSSTTEVRQSIKFIRQRAQDPRRAREPMPGDQSQEECTAGALQFGRLIQAPRMSVFLLQTSRNKKARHKAGLVVTLSVSCLTRRVVA